MDYYQHSTRIVRNIAQAVGAELQMSAGREVAKLRKGPLSIEILPSPRQKRALVIFTTARGYEGITEEDRHYRDNDLVQAREDVARFFTTGKL